MKSEIYYRQLASLGTLYRQASRRALQVEQDLGWIKVKTPTWREANKN